ncbi:MAG TPA: response regulator [Polyangiaceae bacterium]|nr:response regulator [Polyangiaceae bacterium]
MTSHTLLVVDDDDTFRERLVRALVARGVEARGAACGLEAKRVALTESPELAVVDLRLGREDGLDVVRELHAIDPTTRILVLTGYGAIATAVEAVRRGACDYLQKPADVDQILARLEGDGPKPTGEGHVPSLARVEWEHIQRVMVDCGGNVSEAARRLGVHRRSLQRKLAKRPVAR